MNKACANCRKYGTKIFAKGQRCASGKCSFTKRNYQPGSHGSTRKAPKRKSEYGMQLLEKQKAKAEYGMRERQFAKTFALASKSKKTTGDELLKLLESRFDNVIYRLGWAKSRAQARQLITHRFFTLNGQTVNIPSATIKPKIAIKPRKKIEPQKASLPKWLKVDAKNAEAEITHEPLREEIETDLNLQLIIEFYSR